MHFFTKYGQYYSVLNPAFGKYILKGKSWGSFLVVVKDILMVDALFNSGLLQVWPYCINMLQQVQSAVSVVKQWRFRLVSTMESI